MKHRIRGQNNDAIHSNTQLHNVPTREYANWGQMDEVDRFSENASTDFYKIDFESGDEVIVNCELDDWDCVYKQKKRDTIDEFKSS